MAELADAELDEAAVTSLGVGAGLLAADTAYVYMPTEPLRSLGPILAWAHRAGARQLHLFIDEPDAAARLSLRAAQLDPSPAIWLVEGRTATPAQPVASAVSPEFAIPDAGDDVADLIALLTSHGLVVNTEHGVITGELHGLEVARVLDDELGVGLAVGVGRFDREAGAMLRGDRTDDEALAEAVAQVKNIRAADGPAAHPLNRLVRERWLRATVVADPDLVGLVTADAIAAPKPPADLLEANPASAIGVDAAETNVLVVCGLGSNLDMVSTAADHVATLASAGVPVARVVIAVPVGDALPITEALAGYLRLPATVVEVPAPWPR
ncbi:MAG: hypothetical protein HKN26_09315 [Acidimicrobiales bacterium]|nr:hypothetical protein [Acidimicrobiales bacterium]